MLESWRSIEMPASTVKVVSLSREPPTIWSKLPDVARYLRRLFSKQARVFSAGKMLFGVCALLSCAMLSNLKAQTLNARLSIVSTTPARIRIDARLPNATTVLSFRNTYAGVLGLGERIETVEGIRENGARVSLQKLTPGEFQSVEKLSRFAYEVNLAGPRRPADLSHVSSLNSDRGVLIPASHC